jgi:hypothetical protein
LNESISGCFGKAIRSMKDPGTAFPGDSQIKNYREYRTDMDIHQTSVIGKRILPCMQEYWWIFLG